MTITITDGGENPVDGATVSGSWDDGTGVSCTTGTAGTCQVSGRFNGKKTTSATFTVADVSRSGDTYESGVNHDPDGDRDGTSIRVTAP